MPSTQEKAVPNSSLTGGILDIPQRHFKYRAEVLFPYSKLLELGERALIDINE